MKKILLFVLMLVSVAAISQPANYLNIRSRYNLIAVKTDSGFHVPGYSTIPHIRGGTWPGAGNVGVDTVNHKFYFYSGGSWREAGATYTFTNGLTESGGTVTLTNDTTAFANSFYGTNAVGRRGYRPLSEIMQNIYNTDGTLTGNRVVTGGNKTLTFLFDEDLSGSGMTGVNYGSFIGFDAGQVLMTQNGSGIIVQDGLIYQSVSNTGGYGSDINLTKLGGIEIFPNRGNLKIDTLNYTISTTGKKIMLRDTATGLVQNIDPALLGGGSAIEVTQSTAVSLVTSSSLTAGSTYKITGVQPTLYDDGTYSGTTIFLKAETTSLFEKKGFGLFYNPKYDQSITGFGVVDTSASYSVGDTVYWGHYAWVCNTGGLAVATDILNLDGNWTKLPYSNNRYNAVLDEIEYDFANDWIVSRREADANNIVSCSKSIIYYFLDNGLGYSPISVFMWGNAYDYNTGKGVGGNTVTDSYLECTNLYGGYIYSNTLSSSSYISYNTLSSSYIYSNTLSSSYISYNTLSNSSIYSNTLSNSYIYSNTLSSSSIYSNTLSSSSISSNTLSSSSDISSNTLSSSSSIYSNTLSSSSISSNTLSSSSNIYSNTLSSSSYISYNTLSSSYIYVGLSYNLSDKEIKYITGEYGTINVDITSATVVFGDYPKTLFRLPNGTFKLRYYNNSGTLVVANVTD